MILFLNMVLFTKKNMRKIDALVLGFFQDISDKCQSIFGFNNFTLARFSIGCVIICSIMDFPIELQISKVVTGPVVLFMSATTLFLLFVMYRIYELSRAMESFCENNREFKNPFEEAAIIFRLFAIGFFMLNIVSLYQARIQYLQLMNTQNYWRYVHGVMYESWATFYSCCWYFISCTPKPPQKSKIKKLKERLAGWLQGTPALAPVGIPRGGS